MLKLNSIAQKIFGIFSSLYLLLGAILSGYLAFTQGIKFYNIFETIDDALALAFPVVATVTAVLIFIKYVFNSQKISGKLILILLMISVFTACFAISYELPNTIHYVYSGFVLAIIALINIFILKEPKERKGIFLNFASAVFLVVNIIVAAPYVSSVYYTVSQFFDGSPLYSATSVIIITAICIIAAISFLGEGIFAVVVAIGKKANKKTYIIMLVWALINILLKIFIPAQLMAVPIYLLYFYLGIIDTWLVYVNKNLIRYFFYLVFICASLDFYKKEKAEEITQIS